MPALASFPGKSDLPFTAMTPACQRTENLITHVIFVFTTPPGRVEKCSTHSLYCVGCSKQLFPKKSLLFSLVSPLYSYIYTC